MFSLRPPVFPARRCSGRVNLGCAFALFGLLAAVVLLIILAVAVFPSFSGLAGDGAGGPGGGLPSTGNAANNPATLNSGPYNTNSEMRGYADRLDVQRLDALLASKGSALAGHAADIDAVARQYNLDPVVFASMIMLESGWGTNRATREFNNVTSIMTGPNASEFRRFGSVRDSLGYTANMLVNGNYYFTQGRTTLGAVGAVYAPAGASNDPNNTNAGWATNIANLANGSMPTKPPPSGGAGGG